MPIPFAIAGTSALRAIMGSQAAVRPAQLKQHSFGDLARLQQEGMARALALYSGLQSHLQAGGDPASYANLLQNVAPRRPEHRNEAGQTRAQWLDGFDARLGMIEASGIPMSDREERLWMAQAAEWEDMLC